jgi:hypothetical protein
VTSFVFMNNTLYLWPYRENLVGLTVNQTLEPIIDIDATITTCGTPQCSLPSSVLQTNPNWNWVKYPGTSSATPFSPYPVVYGSPCQTGTCPSGCTGGTCFTYQVVAGDTISFATSDGNEITETVTAVIDDWDLAVSPSFTPNASSSGTEFSYAGNSGGYFIAPSQDRVPDEDTLGYPGGSIEGTSNNGSNAVIWAIVPEADKTCPVDGSCCVTNAYYCSSPNQYTPCVDTSTNKVRTKGRVLAYKAPTSGGTTITRLWDSTLDSSAIFCASSFALPLIVNGQVYVPTYAIPASGAACPPDSPSSPFSSGLLVFNLTGN